MTVPALLTELRARSRLFFKVKRRSRNLRIRLPTPKLRVTAESTPYKFDCRVSRVGNRYSIAVPGEGLDFMMRYDRLASPLYMLSLCPPAIQSITINLSDGNSPSQAPFSFSSRSSTVIPLPDKDFFKSRGFEVLRSHSITNDVPWDRRSPVMRWRGRTHGPGGTDYASPGAEWDEKLMPRIRAALLLKNVPDADFAFTGANTPEVVARLRRDGLLGDKIAKADWVNDKFALDIDGYTNTWSALMVRLHLGCCVIKVDSQEGYRQWYYDRIRPWEHFVPVRADLTDLIEKIEWARSNDAEARQIAKSGQAFARSMTFESEMDWAVDAICATQGVSRN